MRTKQEKVKKTFPGDGNGYYPRNYQLDVWRALNQGAKVIVKIWPRRTGKDINTWNMVIGEAWKSPKNIYYCFPTAKLARRAIFKATDNEGRRFTDYIPKEWIKNIRENEMEIEFHNGSIITILGLKDVDITAVGTNPHIVVFSEWSILDPTAYEYIRPILEMNGGVAFFVYTPRGKNHGWSLYQTFLELREKDPIKYYVSKYTAYEMQTICPEVYPEGFLEDQKEYYMKNDGDLRVFNQEYLTDFESVTGGSIFGNHIKIMEEEGRLLKKQRRDYVSDTIISFDVGSSDATVMIFWQIKNGKAIIIDVYSDNYSDPEIHAELIVKRGYNYSDIVLPHDVNNKVYGQQQRVKAQFEEHLPRNIRDKIHVNDRTSNKWDSIIYTRNHLQYIAIDNETCSIWKGDQQTSLSEILKQYEKKYSKELKVFLDIPAKKNANHYADAIREGIVFIMKNYSHLVKEYKLGYNKRDDRQMIKRARLSIRDQISAQKNKMRI